MTGVKCGIGMEFSSQHSSSDAPLFGGLEFYCALNLYISARYYANELFIQMGSLQLVYNFSRALFTGKWTMAKCY